MLVNWNILFGNMRYINGIFFRGVLVLKMMLDLVLEVDVLGFWINMEFYEGDDSKLNISFDGIEMFYFFNGK